MNRRNFISGLAALPIAGKFVEKRLKEPHVVPEFVVSEPELPQYVACSPECWIWESPTYTVLYYKDLE